MYNEVQRMIGCSGKMISIAFKWKQNQRDEKKTRDYHWKGWKNSQKNKDSMISSRVIKDGLKVTARTGTNRRRMYEANQSARSPKKVSLSKSTYFNQQTLYFAKTIQLNYQAELKNNKD
ncbi:hypothetical protein XENOCAPTIV_000910 [Xenoophorus captivus]|uniref:Uncharacterized protein n=1 Tax=Xenoophorus captivus TaxID=1517983 RepID=A0ABV0QQ45_9TELE